MEEITGHSASQLTGRPFSELIYADDRDLFIKNIDSSELGDQEPPQVRLTCKNSETRWVRISSYNIGLLSSDEAGETVGLVVDTTKMVELSERLDMTNRQLKETNEQLRLANLELEVLNKTDELTGLKSRRAFREESDRLIDSREDPISVIYADLDDFKRYNTIYGHATGDEVLKTVAILLRAASRRKSDFIARVGGDEFVILLPRTRRKAALMMVQMIQETFSGYNMVNPDMTIGITVGVATAIKSSRLNIAIERADTQMLKAKKEKNQIP